MASASMEWSTSDPPARPAPHGKLLITAGVPVKVVSERLGHATPAFTIETYQHVLPDMQATLLACSNSSSSPTFYPSK